ncbi:hypothetical protein PY365_28680 [Roseiarcaceae bacterium H3SJ34-1]|uniref:hypothetical protein n=1 Tax=Terripilifer ovatus TaxID=3032367 RepID=UPI003AB9B5D8|nr:hypothetical protein [Roseiarcaceae bacterium H3SJ34-1]
MTLSPSEVATLVGFSPDVLRDWRRRGFLNDLGKLLLPNGKTTDDPNHPDLANVGRQTWVYSKGDLLAFAIAKHAIELGVGIEIAIEISDHVVPHVDAWLDPKGRKNYREPRWFAAWPSTEGLNPTGADHDHFAVARVSSLERLAEVMGSKAIILDTKKLAEAMPAALVEKLGYR